jgi:hypothetical protein
MEKILLLEISELRYLELTCPNKEKCGKRYIFDLQDGKTFREACPMCNTDWQQSVRRGENDPFVAFRRFCDALAGFQAKFRVTDQQIIDCGTR